MELDLSKDSLIVYEALASETRLKILELLGNNKLNISEIAEHLQLSSAIITRHIQKMEEARLVKSEKKPGRSGVQKMVYLAVDDIHITFPEKIFRAYHLHSTDLKIGHFTDFEVAPTCGLATKDEIVGKLDDSKYFFDSNRVNASLLWFSKGFVEYKIPNLIQKDEIPELLEISLELSSEFPRSNNVWPSDISIYINDVKVGVCNVPGNFSDIRGKYTPSWWNDDFSQYGLLKTIRTDQLDTGINGEFASTVSLKDLNILDNPIMTLRLAVEDNAKNVGGMTLFGEDFGNFKQNIKVNLYYSDKKPEI
ncbi:ArsR/SmtB family transcription factor [Carnobacterium gallinarum]|uniref:ArsR/SmtB family transcription factor n=1 Tax=Carnobacterium gallinarum TaxID=2749 RepID=UPI0005524D60|nr:ArsR family transcriptional regulator [Carnobacterium gallinarum]